MVCFIYLSFIISGTIEYILKWIDTVSLTGVLFLLLADLEMVNRAQELPTKVLEYCDILLPRIMIFAFLIVGHSRIWHILNHQRLNLSHEKRTYFVIDEQLGNFLEFAFKRKVTQFHVTYALELVFNFYIKLL